MVSMRVDWCTWRNRFSTQYFLLMFKLPRGKEKGASIFNVEKEKKVEFCTGNSVLQDGKYIITLKGKKNFVITLFW